jgi:hypothetical protein
MEHVGIDVHARESQVCILTESGEIVERRIRTRPLSVPAASRPNRNTPEPSKAPLRATP